MPRILFFTHHAEEQLTEREIDRTWVERTINDPEVRQRDPGDATLERLFRALPERGGRFLRVVVSFESEERCRVVTVHLDRAMRKFRQ